MPLKLLLRDRLAAARRGPVGRSPALDRFDRHFCDLVDLAEAVEFPRR